MYMSGVRTFSVPAIIHLRRLITPLGLLRALAACSAVVVGAARLRIVVLLIAAAARRRLGTAAGAFALLMETCPTQF